MKRLVLVLLLLAGPAWGDVEITGDSILVNEESVLIISDMSALETRVTTLESQVQSLEAQAAALALQVQALEAQVATLEAGVPALASRVKVTTDTDTGQEWTVFKSSLMVNDQCFAVVPGDGSGFSFVGTPCE